MIPKAKHLKASIAVVAMHASLMTSPIPAPAQSASPKPMPYVAPSQIPSVSQPAEVRVNGQVLAVPTCRNRAHLSGFAPSLEITVRAVSGLWTFGLGAPPMDSCFPGIDWGNWPRMPRREIPACLSIADEFPYPNGLFGATFWAQPSYQAGIGWTRAETWATRACRLRSSIFTSSRLKTLTAAWEWPRAGQVGQVGVGIISGPVDSAPETPTRTIRKAMSASPATDRSGTVSERGGYLMSRAFL